MAGHKKDSDVEDCLRKQWVHMTGQSGNGLRNKCVRKQTLCTNRSCSNMRQMLRKEVGSYRLHYADASKEYKFVINDALS